MKRIIIVVVGLVALTGCTTRATVKAFPQDNGVVCYVLLSSTNGQPRGIDCIQPSQQP